MPLDELLIRPAREEDAAWIRSWIYREHLDPTSLKWRNFLIAEWQGERAAIGQIKRFRDCDELGSLVTAPHLRGKGIAAELIAALEQQARRPLYLVCRSTMEPYYLRFGFRTIGWRNAPRSLQLKLLPTLPLRLFGISILVMQKHEDTFLHPHVI